MIGRFGKRNLTPEQIAEARRRRAAGDFLVDIARDFGVSKIAISKHTKGCAVLSTGAQLARRIALRRGLPLAVADAPAWVQLRRDVPRLTAEEAFRSLRRIAA